MLAKLEMAEAELRINMFTLDLRAPCATFVYVEVARPYLLKGLEFGLVVVRWSDPGRPPNQLNLQSTRAPWITVHPSSVRPALGFPKLPSLGP